MPTKLLDRSLKQGWSGLHEVLMPTLFISQGVRVKDFGGDGKFVQQGYVNKFYNRGTHLWRPPFIRAGNLLNKVYHPVKAKPKITADFKFKVSFIVIVDDADSIKMTLLKSIRNNLEYGNIEFIILDKRPCKLLPEWIDCEKEWITQEKLIFYNIARAYRFTTAQAQNIALKLSSGDIICLLDGHQSVGDGFAYQVNNEFKSIWAINTGSFNPRPKKPTRPATSKSFFVNLQLLKIV